MELRFVVLILLFSNNLIGMDLLPESFAPAIESQKRCLLKFIDSDPFTITNNMKAILVLNTSQPFKKEPAIQEPLNKALSVLVTLWNPEFEANGLKLAQILMEAGADPFVTVSVFSESNFWEKEEDSSDKNQKRYRMSETISKSTVFDGAHGKLKTYLKEFISQSDE